MVYPDNEQALPPLAAPTGAAAPTWCSVCGGNGTEPRPFFVGCAGEKDGTHQRLAASPAGRAPARAGTTPPTMLESQDVLTVAHRLADLLRADSESGDFGRGLEDRLPLADAIVEKLTRAAVTALAEELTRYDQLRLLAVRRFDGDGMQLFTHLHAALLNRLLREHHALRAEVSRLSARPAAQQTEQKQDQG